MIKGSSRKQLVKVKEYGPIKVSTIPLIA